MIVESTHRGDALFDGLLPAQQHYVARLLLSYEINGRVVRTRTTEERSAEIIRAVAAVVRSGYAEEVLALRRIGCWGDSPQFHNCFIRWDRAPLDEVFSMVRHGAVVETKLSWIPVAVTRWMRLGSPLSTSLIYSMDGRIAVVGPWKALQSVQEYIDSGLTPELATVMLERGQLG